MWLHAAGAAAAASTLYCRPRIACQVVDSIMALYRTEFSGRGELADRQQRLGQMLALLKRVS